MELFDQKPSGTELGQGFIGVRGFSAVNSLMFRPVLFFGLGLVAFCLPVTAQQTNPSLDASYTMALYRPEVFNTVDSSTLINRLPVRVFLDGTRFPVSSPMGRMGMVPVDFLSVALLGAKAHKTNVARVDGKDYPDPKDSSAEVMNSSLNPIRYGGETGVFYGRSTGKFGAEEMGSYFQGEMGNDKFHITVGGSYEELNGRGSRWGR